MTPSFERVDVHQGGQAVVGSIHGGQKKMKTTSYTANKPDYSFNKAPRCGAKTKHNNGNPCRCPAVRNRNRCRLHGGAKSSGGQKHNQNAQKHGMHTAEVKLFKKTVKNTLKNVARFNKDLKIF